MFEFDRNPDSRQLRWFAGLLAIFAIGLALSGKVHSDPAVMAILAASLGLAFVAFARPQAVRPIYLSWMLLVFPIGFAVGVVLLAVIYFGVLTPLGWIMRWKRGDVLGRKLDPRAESYWSVRPAAPSNERYFRQF